MPTSYTSLLGLALPVTGELAGTWGDTVNNYITSYLDSSVAGTQTISGSQTAVTLSVTNGTTLTQVGSGATGSAQYNIINCTGNPASLLTITAPAASKTYLIINATSTSQSVKIVGTGPTTGVTLIAGEKALVAWNGSDFIKVASTAVAAGSNTQVQYNSGGNLAGSANLTFDGTNFVLGTGGTSGGFPFTQRVAASGSPVSAFRITNGSDSTFDVTLQTSLASIGNGIGSLAFLQAGTEAMRLTSTGLGIGTSSPTYKLDVSVTGNNGIRTTSSAGQQLYLGNTGGEAVVGTLNNYGLGFITNGSVRGYFDSSGNLGLGVTPSAWGASAGKAFDISSYSAVYQNLGNNATGIGNNVYINSSPAFIYKNTAAASAYQQVNGAHFWYTAGSGTAGTVISFTQSMTLDGSGNLGVGQTSPSGRLDVAGTTSYFRPAGGSGTFLQITAGAANGTVDLIASANSGAYPALTISTGGSERARITSGGDLLVGNTTQYGTANRAAVFSANKFGLSIIDTTAQTTGVGGALNLGGNYRSAGDAQAFVRIEAAKENATDTNYAYAMAFSTTPNGGTFTERARITSGGDLLVGTSSGQVAATVVAYRSSAATACVGSWNAATSGDNVFEVFNTEATATQRGSIDYNRAGGLTRYNITSDYRAKDIIGPAQNTGATIDALKVYEGMMKGATQTRPMMIAHEAQAVVPFCVSGTKDEINEDGTPKYQQMDHASLVPLLIAEIQSLRARVAQLEAK